MLGQHYVRVGVLGSVGRFAAADAQRYPRGTRVVCRTSRGLEVGEVLAPLDQARQPIRADGIAAAARDGRGRSAAGPPRKEPRRSLPGLRSSGWPSGAFRRVLVDVEHLFDGQSLFFYFLGETTPELDALTAELAEVYEAQVQFRKFTDTLTAGCGPHCGTDEAEAAAASGGCSTCAVACGVRARAA